MSIYFHHIQRYIWAVVIYRSKLYAERSEAKKFFSRKISTVQKTLKKIHFFVFKTFRILVFSWKNRGLNRKKHIFAQKKHKKALSEYFCQKKSNDDEKKHKKAHVLFKSTPYKAWIHVYIV